MAYYIDTDNFITATAVWTNSVLTVKAPDGYYSFGGNYRQQVGGFLMAVTSCVSNYCYDGIWELDDPAHPGGGSVTYIDSLGIENTINNIWMDYPVNFSAISIVSTIGCAPCEVPIPYQINFSNSVPLIPCGDPSIPSNYPLALFVTQLPIVLGDIVYSDYSLTTVYPGDSQWYWISQVTSYKINGVGEVIDINYCI